MLTTTTTTTIINTGVAFKDSSSEIIIGFSSYYLIISYHSRDTWEEPFIRITLSYLVIKTNSSKVEYYFRERV